MKRRLIISACMATAFIVAIAISFLLGAAHVLRKEVKASVAMNATVLSLIETGKTDRATQVLEPLLIGGLNALDSIERSELRYAQWYIFNVSENSGERWTQLRHYAETRVKTKRDEWNHLTSHPEEAVKRFETAFGESQRSPDRTNVTVQVTGGGKDSIEMELKNHL